MKGTMLAVSSIPTMTNTWCINVTGTNDENKLQK